MAMAAAMPRELRFVHNDAPCVAILVDEVPLSTAPCCLCGLSLQGHAFYTTSPPLFDVHAECARASSFLHRLSGGAGDGRTAAHDADRSLGGHRGGHHYYYYQPGAAAYGQQNYYNQWHWQQQAQSSYGDHQSTAGSSSSSFAQRLGFTAIGAFLQVLFSTMAGAVFS